MSGKSRRSKDGFPRSSRGHRRGGHGPLKRVIAFKGVTNGVELRDLGLIEVKHLRLTLEVCAENGLDGFVDFDEPFDFVALRKHVEAGGSLIGHPGSGKLWVVRG